jgi:arylformamidase
VFAAHRRIYDITVPLGQESVVWPGDPEVEISAIARIANGDVCNLTCLALSNHTGTHVDCPWHFVDDGARLDAIPLHRWCGPCFVADLRAVARTVDASHLDAAGIPAGVERLLLRTRNSNRWSASPTTFASDYVALSPDAAQWIVARRIGLVGIDYYSVDAFDDHQHRVHHLLLGNDTLIIENLDLSAIAAGAYDLLCLPLKVVGVDGAPARVVLVDPD